MTHVSLFTGIGGLDLAAEAAGFETVLQVEREPYALRILERHWPEVPRIHDVREVTSESVTGPVTVVSGGFPCQPFSAAGKRRGTEDDRYLWPELLRIVEELQPRWVIGENVSGLLSIDDGMEIDRMLAALEARDYAVRVLHYPAAGVGAPHKRDRVFIVANANGARSRGKGRDALYQRRESGETRGEGIPQNAVRKDGVAISDNRTASQNVANTSSGEQFAGTEKQKVLRALSENRTIDNHTNRPSTTHASNVANTKSSRRGEGDTISGGARKRTRAPAEWCRPSNSGCSQDVADASSAGREERDTPSVAAESGYRPWADDPRGRVRPTQPDVGRVAHGISDWLDGEPADVPRVATGVKDRAARLKTLGNAVVPAQAYPIFASIAHAEEALK